MSTPWTEKYRPVYINDIQNQDEIVSTISGGISNGNIPHLLLYGPPGTGKTSTALCACREIFNTFENTRRNVIELNASDERGISVVRGKIKSFAQTSSSANFPFKIVILDEVDTMTPDAQAALRRTIETYSTTTRFFLICNYVSKVINPIVSRCAKFRFKPISCSSIVEYLQYICKEQDIIIKSDRLEKIASLSNGDMRRAINSTQMISMVDAEDDYIEDIMGCISKESVVHVWDIIVNVLKYTTSDVMKYVPEFVGMGYPMKDFTETMLDLVINESLLSQVVKSHIIRNLSEFDIHINSGCSYEVQLVNLILSSRSLVKAQ